VPDELDGLTVDLGRPGSTSAPSNTEPLLRLNVEAEEPGPWSGLVARGRTLLATVASDRTELPRARRTPAADPRVPACRRPLEYKERRKVLICTECDDALRGARRHPDHAAARPLRLRGERARAERGSARLHRPAGAAARVRDVVLSRGCSPAPAVPLPRLPGASRHAVLRPLRALVRAPPHPAARAAPRLPSAGHGCWPADAPIVRDVHGLRLPRPGARGHRHGEGRGAHRRLGARSPRPSPTGSRGPASSSTPSRGSPRCRRASVSAASTMRGPSLRSSPSARRPARPAARRRPRSRPRERYRATLHLPGSDLVLVDDVLTTGATAWRAAAALRDAGAGSVVLVSSPGPAGIRSARSRALSRRRGR
jgi:hypothetical protein